MIAQNCGNDNSTVKHFRRGNFNVLSLGDVESNLISARLSRAKILSRETDVMILAHHGADNGFTTKKFIQYLEPKLAICSSNYGNRYDHPRDEIRNLLRDEQVQLMTTKTGDVIVMSMGDHTGEYRAINFKADSTEVRSECDFVSKKKRILGFNADTIRNLYANEPSWRNLPR